MYTRTLPNEVKIMHAIIAERFPEIFNYNFSKIGRGISNVKYWLTAEPNSYVIKLFSGHEHRRRALSEHRLLSALHAQAVIPVPAPAACIEAESDSPFSYVIMSKVEGVPLDETIHLLAKNEAESLGAEVGVLLSKLHRSDSSIYGKVPVKEALDSSVASRRSSDLQVAAEAEKLGVLTQEEAKTFLELRSVARRLPTEHVLIHGDLGLDNIIVTTGPELRVAALIDLEHCAIGEAAVDFVKTSVSSGEQVDAFVDALRMSYYQASSALRSDVADFRLQILDCEILSDLRVAIDLAREPFRDLYSLATTEHQAWKQVSRLYRNLREGPLIPLDQ